MKHKHYSIPAICYGVCLILWLLGSLWTLGRDFAARQMDRLDTFSMEVEDFQLAEMDVLAENVYTSQGMDPQMLWENPDGREIRTLRMQVDFSAPAREMCLYYTNQAGAPFDIEKRVFARQEGNQYLFVLPREPVASLRLDPCSPEEGHATEMTFGTFTINEPLPWWSYFTPGWAGAFQMVLYPGLAAAALALLRDTVQAVRQRKGTAPKETNDAADA